MEAVFKSKAHTTGKSYVAFSPNGKRIATAGCDGILKIWNVRRILDRGNFDELDRQRPKREKIESKLHEELKLEQGPVSCLAIDPKSLLIAIGFSKHNTILIITRKPHFHVLKTLNKHTRPLTALQWVVDDKRNRLVSLSEDRTIIDWDVDKADKIYKFNTSGVPLSVDLSTIFFVSGHNNGDVRLWSLSAQKEVRNA